MPHAQPSLSLLIEQRYGRRDFFGFGLAVLAGSVLGGCSTGGREQEVAASSPTSPASRLHYRSVAISTADQVVVPPGFEVQVLYRWGDPISDGPEFLMDASQDAAAQALQSGTHHDGLAWYPLPLGSGRSDHGLLCVNHEYFEPVLLHGQKQASDSERVAKEWAAVGVSVVETKLQGGQWQVQRPSRYARRVTANTPHRLSGPAAGHRLMQTSADPNGSTVLGTFGNCGSGWTPWGTYLTCEENFQFYFGASTPRSATADESLYGLVPDAKNLHWGKVDDRFDLALEPNEAHRFGWVVEIDPSDPTSMPVKHTALGRFAHESAKVVACADGRIAVYTGDDSADEFLYKFVSAEAYDPAHREHALGLLSAGTLHVAKLEADGSGRWIPLIHGRDGLDTSNGFADQAEVLIYARRAARAVGATPLDRCEWITHDPQRNRMYVTCTNNSRRAQTGPGSPRTQNIFGHVLSWAEAGGDAAALAFNWDIYSLGGDVASSSVSTDAYACPDGLWMGPGGVLWIQTDISDSVMRAGPFAAFGNNMLVGADPETGESRRFLVGPVGCEITGMHSTPDGCNYFISIQHPGDVPKDLQEQGLSLKADNPRVASNWPDFDPNGRPRSATIVIRRSDGKPIEAPMA